MSTGVCLDEYVFESHGWSFAQGFADIIDAMDKHELAQEKDKAVLAEKGKHAATQKTLQAKEQALADTAKELHFYGKSKIPTKSVCRLYDSRIHYFFEKV